MSERKRVPRPDWLKIRLTTGENFRSVNHLLNTLSLNTVCQEARCPNIYECFNNHTATFLILGPTCSRRCRFCSVETGALHEPDPEEPRNVARAVVQLGLEHAVITSVTRDDLEDEGAEQFVRTIKEINALAPACTVELLIPDFNGRAELLEQVLDAGPAILGHNLETVPALHRRVRPQADFERSLEILRLAARYRVTHAPGLKVKSGIMVGLGESESQVLNTMRAIRRTGCDIMTIGQYLSPLASSLPVERFYSPEEFSSLRRMGMDMGFKHVEAGPLVRSSYHAKEQADNL